MDSGTVTAVIGAAAALVVAVLNSVFSSRSSAKLKKSDRELAEQQGTQQKELAVLTDRMSRDVRLEQRAHEAREALDQYREPLLRAAIDLAARLVNIRNQGFLDVYLAGDDHRAHIARASTYYRFARYWCVVENLYDRVTLVRFSDDDETRRVVEALREVGGTFASDQYGSSFMMWREEQRAVAELMRDDAAPAGCRGYATFVDQYDDLFYPWFAAFDQSLKATTARGSTRFRALQGRLANLASQLDVSGTYISQTRDLSIRAKP